MSDEVEGRQGVRPVSGVQCAVAGLGVNTPAELSADVDPVTDTTWRQTNSPSRAKYQGQLHPSPSLGTCQEKFAKIIILLILTIMRILL